MRKLSWGNATIVVLALSGFGCNGLTVNLTANPNPADPGEPVQWNISVRNDTNCTTTEQMVDLPPDIPDLPETIGAFALFFGFVPELDEIGPAAFCRLVMTCQDFSCITTRVEESLGPEVAAALNARMQAASTEPPALPTLGACQEIGNTVDGIFGFCAFESLSPGETATATFMSTAPDTGSRNAAQVAFAFAPAMGEDCRPGSEISDGEWLLGGCFPLVADRAAPALSPVVTGLGAALLLLVGVTGLYRRRRS